MNPSRLGKRRSTGDVVVDTDLNLCVKIGSLKTEVGDLNKRIRRLESEVNRLGANLTAKNSELSNASLVHEQQLQAANLSFKIKETSIKDLAERDCQLKIDRVESENKLKMDRLAQFIAKLKATLTDLNKNSVLKTDFSAMADILSKVMSRGLLGHDLETNRDSLDLNEFSKISIIDWITRHAGMLAAVTSVKSISNAELMADTPGDVSALIYFICRVFEHARVECSKEISSLAGISKTLIAPINSIICTFFAVINVHFESPLGKMIGFETTVNGNVEELSREIATAIPGGVSSKRFKSKLNLILKVADLRNIKMKSIKDMVTMTV